MSLLLKSFMEKLVPSTGDLPHKEFSEAQTYPSESAAENAFKLAKSRLLNPQKWKDLTDSLGAKFEPFNHAGAPISGNIEKGDYLKISIPLPGSVNCDWVKVEALKEKTTAGEEMLGLRVRPSEDLQKKGHETAHFFSKEATSTWVLHRSGKTLMAYYFGRGETPNEEGESFWKKLRDTVIAWAGVAGFSDLQWQGMLKGLLEDTEKSA